MKKTFLSLALVAAAGAAHAESDKGIELGILTCTFENKSNVVVYSKADYKCHLDSAGHPNVEGIYHGKIHRLGVDLQWKAHEKLIWTVLAITGDKDYGPIEGDYVGAGADVSAGLGLGANVLVGGLNKSFALQPLSVSGQTGVGLSAGVEELKLTYKGKKAE